MAWTQSFPEAYEAQMAELEVELEQRYQLLFEADQAYQRGEISEQEISQLEAEYQEYLSGATGVRINGVGTPIARSRTR